MSEKEQTKRKSRPPSFQARSSGDSVKSAEPRTSLPPQGPRTSTSEPLDLNNEGAGGAGGSRPSATEPSTATSNAAAGDILADLANDTITKTEKFMGFVQGAGIRMAFVRTLVALYEEMEKPDEPLRYICGLMGKGLPTLEEILAKQEEVAQLRVQYDLRRDENHSLRQRLAPYITPEERGEEPEEDYGFELEFNPNNYSYLNEGKENAAATKGGTATTEEEVDNDEENKTVSDKP